MNTVDRRTFLGTPRRRLRADHRAAPRARRPRLHRAERHDPARAGRLRDAGAASGEHGARVAARPAVRGRGRSQPRLAGLRGLGGVRQPRAHPRRSSTTRSGARATRASAPAATSRARSWRRTTRSRIARARHPRLRGLPRDAREGNRHPGHRQHHARSPARAASTSRRCGRARPPSRTSPSRACCTKCAAWCRPRARARRRRTCWPTATSRTATRWRRGSTRASSAPCAKCTTGRTGRSGRRACRSTTRPGHPCRPASTGRCGRGPSRIVRTIRATRSPSIAAGTRTARAALATWGTTASGSRTASSISACRTFVEARPNNDAFVDAHNVSDGGHVSLVGVSEGQHRALASSRHRRSAVGGHVLVRRRDEAADAGGTLRGRRGPVRRGHAVHRRQGQDPVRLPRPTSRVSSRAAVSRRSRGRSPAPRGRHDQPGRRVGERHPDRRQVARQLRAGGRRWPRP